MRVNGCRLLEERGGDEQLLVSEKLGAAAAISGHALRQNLEALAGVLRRDGVPKFRRAVVQVVDRVQVHVLRVPWPAAYICEVSTASSRRRG